MEHAALNNAGVKTVKTEAAMIEELNQLAETIDDDGNGTESETES